MTLQVLLDGRRRWYYARCACLGLGMLCKYNFALFALALLLATLASPTYRRRLATWHLGGALGLALAIMLPHLLWLAANYHELMASLRFKGMVGEGGPLLGRIYGLGSILRNIPIVLGPLAVVAFVFWPGSVRPRAEPLRDPEIWLRRVVVFSMLLLGGVVLAGGMANIRVYWMLPILMVVPLVFFLRLEHENFKTWQWAGFGSVVLATTVGLGAVRNS